MNDLDDRAVVAFRSVADAIEKQQAEVISLTMSAGLPQELMRGEIVRPMGMGISVLLSREATITIFGAEADGTITLQATE